MDIDIDIDNDLLILGYKVCSLNISFDTKIKMDCEHKCLPQCNEVYFKREIILSKNCGENNLTKKINLFPMNIPHIKYVETLKLDLNQLIYTVGGIVGFWFGLSPKEMPDLILYLTNLLKLLIIWLYRAIFKILKSCFHCMKKILFNAQNRVKLLIIKTTHRIYSRD